MRAANFVEETTTSIAGTLGNGAVTLSAVAGRPRFSTVFTSATPIRYVIENTITGAFEVGMGVVSANVLTRTLPQITWDGTAYDDTVPAPLQFGSAPASGNVRVRLAPVAEGVGPAIPNMITTDLSNIGVWGQYPLSAHFHAQNAGTTNTYAPGAYCFQYYRLDHGGVLDGYQFEAGGAVASNNMKLALYAVGSNGFPTNKIVDFGEITTNVTGVRAFTDASLWTPTVRPRLTPGWYAFGFIVSISYGLRSFINSTAAANQISPAGRRSSGYEGWMGMITKPGTYTDPMPDPAGSFSAGSIEGRQLWVGLKVTP